MKPDEIKNRALHLIATSTGGQFDSSLHWGQWCRLVARAGQEADETGLEILAKEIGE